MKTVCLFWVARSRSQEKAAAEFSVAAFFIGHNFQTIQQI
jgi:hypothetical protein